MMDAEGRRKQIRAWTMRGSDQRNVEKLSMM